MKWIYLFGIIILYCLMLNASQQDCHVDDVYMRKFWSGEEVTFSSYVSENDVVNIKISYHFLDETDYFTTFHFSPSKRYSKKIETIAGEIHIYPLQTMEMANDWVQFKISAQQGTIEVFYEPNTHEMIPIIQASHTFKDLIIHASNISFCKDEREWEVSEGIHQHIPLGIHTIQKTFPMKFYSHRDYQPFISVFNFSKSLTSSEYILLVEKKKIILKPLKGSSEDIIIPGNEDVITIEIFSKVGNFSVLVSYNTEPSSSTITTPEAVNIGENLTCNENVYITTLICLSIFIFILTGVSIGIRFNICKSRIRLTKLLLKNEESYHQENRNDGTNEQRISLTTSTPEEDNV